MINRKIIENIGDALFQGKAIIIYGPRQSGKTTLCKMLENKYCKKTKWLNGDDADISELFNKPSSTSLSRIVQDIELLIIDEAQRIENIGLCIKILVDNFPSLQVIATGSSSLDLANTTREPLTGRKREFLLLPFSYYEMVSENDIITENRNIEQRLIFGSYPEVVLSPGKETTILKELAGSYLYKDILSWETLRHPEKLDRLVKAIALQIGSEVSYNEIGQITGMASETVERYITLLEQAFIIFRLPAFSRNLRNELKKSRKIFFYDIGIRNALLGQFSPLSGRADTGALWENYLIVERLKSTYSIDRQISRYFWRTTQQQEIDYIEEINGELSAFEFKWNPNKKARIPKTFSNAYPEANTQIISRNNISDFLL